MTIVINSNHGSFKIDVEVDEHQHKSYPEFCEYMRMRKLAQYFFLPTLYIRFNPDEYKTSELEEVPMRKRLIRLSQVIRKYKMLERLPCAVGAIQMYFDGWIENKSVEISIIE